MLVGADVGAMGILTTYLVEEQGFSQTASKAALVLFLSGVALGRLVIGRFADTPRIPRMILTLFGASTVAFTVLFGFNLGALTFLVAFLAGLSMSAMLPLILAYAGIAYREMAGTVMGAIKVAFPVGGILTPFLMSIVAGASLVAMGGDDLAAVDGDRVRADVGGAGRNARPRRRSDGAEHAYEERSHERTTNFRRYGLCVSEFSRHCFKQIRSRRRWIGRPRRE